MRIITSNESTKSPHIPIRAANYKTFFRTLIYDTLHILNYIKLHKFKAISLLDNYYFENTSARKGALAATTKQ